MTPAPVTPAIPGHTPHSRAADHPCPRRTIPPESAVACHPALSATRPLAHARPSAHTGPAAPSPMTNAHLQPPSPKRTNHPAGPGLNGLPDPHPSPTLLHRQSEGAGSPPGYRPERMTEHGGRQRETRARTAPCFVAGARPAGDEQCGHRKFSPAWNSSAKPWAPSARTCRTPISFTSTSEGCSMAQTMVRAMASGAIASLSRDTLSWTGPRRPGDHVPALPEPGSSPAGGIWPRCPGSDRRGPRPGPVPAAAFPRAP